MLVIEAFEGTNYGWFQTKCGLTGLVPGFSNGKINSLLNYGKHASTSGQRLKRKLFCK